MNLRLITRATSSIAVMFVLAFALIGASPVNAKDTADSPALKAAQNMVQAWNELNLDKMIDAFSEDAILHSMMIEPIKGRKALREHLGRLLQGATRLELQLKNVAVVGNTVFLERVDDFDYNGRRGVVPVVGVLEIEDGKVKVWREYYDRAQLLKEMGLEGGLPPAKH